MAFLVLNGWQRIKRLNFIQKPSFGIQVTYKLSEKLLLNYSNFTGTDIQSNLNALRTFHNLYMQFAMSKKLGMIAGFDIGVQQKSKGSLHFNYWLSPVVILRYDFNSQLAAALRAEYYQDMDGTIIAVKTNAAFKTAGLSLNMDYKPISIMLFRLEGRWLNNETPIFENRNGLSRNNFFLTLSMCLKINRYLMK